MAFELGEQTAGKIADDTEQDVWPEGVIDDPP